jgi:hypothetical protein
MILSEREFLNWSAGRLLELKNATIVSRTPLIFFKEKTPSERKYRRALEARLERRDLPTTYLMSESELSKSLKGKDASLEERIREMMRWRDRWSAGNVVARVITKGHFPSASIWIGEAREESKAFMKIAFENEKDQQTVWLDVSDEIAAIKELVGKLAVNSIPFPDYLEVNSEELGALEP